MDPNSFSRAVTMEETVTFLTTRPDLAHLVTMAVRPGVKVLFGCIEWQWYSPHTDRNRFFHMNVIQWQDIPWLVCSFPNGRLPAVRGLARHLGLRIADGVPTLIEPAGPGDREIIREGFPRGLTARHFPGGVLPQGGDNRSMWNIENDSSSPLHTGRLKLTREEGEKREMAVIDAFVEGKRPRVQDIHDYIYGLRDRLFD